MRVVESPAYNAGHTQFLWILCCFLFRISHHHFSFHRSTVNRSSVRYISASSNKNSQRSMAHNIVQRCVFMHQTWKRRSSAALDAPTGRGALIDANVGLIEPFFAHTHRVAANFVQQCARAHKMDQTLFLLSSFNLIETWLRNIFCQSGNALTVFVVVYIGRCLELHKIHCLSSLDGECAPMALWRDMAGLLSLMTASTRHTINSQHKNQESSASSDNMMNE